MKTLLTALILMSSYAVADSDWMNDYEPIDPFKLQPIERPLTWDTWTSPYTNQSNSYGTVQTPQGVKSIHCNTHYNPTTGRSITSCW